MNLGIVAAVNSRDVLEQNLLASPLVAEQHVPLRIEEGHTCASQAYNAGLRALDTEFVVFAHQDVYLPRGWEHNLERAVRELEQDGVEWGVLGIYGVQSTREHVGLVWSTGLNAECDARVSSPQPVVSIDEVVLVLRRGSGLTFDESLPGFHMYGTDIVQMSLREGLGAFVFHGPVIHNSTRTDRLDPTYWRAHRYLREKWRDRLPIPTAVVDIPMPLLRRARLAYRTFKKTILTKPIPNERLHDPIQKARDLGYEQVT